MKICPFFFHNFPLSLQISTNNKMKIISKYTDYYDYKASEYGTDDLLVYDRRKTYPPTPSLVFPKEYAEKDSVILAELYIGNKLIYLFVSPQKIYTQFDLVFPEKTNNFHFTDARMFHFSDGNAFRCEYWSYYSYEYRGDKKFYHGEQMWHNYYGKTHQIINRKWRDFQEKFALDGYYSMFPNGIWQEPILISYMYRSAEGLRKELFVNPCLMNLGIFIDADFVWQSLVEYLSFLRSEKEITPEMPNDTIITNKGFDKKTSFRPKMKKKK